MLPISALTEDGPIEFFVPGDGSKYLDLADTLLQLQLQVTNADGSRLPAAEKVGLINYPLNTIFSQVDVTLADRLISQSSSTHPYRSMIEALLNFSDASLKSQFTAGMFFKDKSGQMDTTDLTGDAVNEGLVNRAQRVAGSRSFYVIGPLHADIFFCERLLLNNVDLRVKLIKANNDFCFISPANSDHKLKILSASLFVKRVAVSPAVSLGHEAALRKENALYPLSRINVKTYSIPQQSRTCQQDNLFLGPMPRYVVVGLVAHTAFTGRRESNPFNFANYNMEYLALTQEGRQIPSKPFQPQFSERNAAREFYNLFTSTGRHLKDLPLCIDHEDFMDGYALYVFNLSANDDTSALSTVSNGSVRLEMRFKAPLPHTVTLIVYACYDSILEIDSKRQVLVDYY
ncbi:uncharacterized protein F54H12.2-like [Corythoichthys intestinalis]|nr:uncharacterized protein F54H12.2-like [Corythoichthys intestinalis]XP_057678363.1 uncharacterized protein F54H12.2-like [Corythoichthys intestinalis]XP_057678365.1 uncharacterized protein F54H12.2-like [Corythoichthys intestinalis]XP_057679558.1 uncharacterized protein F54H12.2-like [Corythoichthys intestinalis]XP_057686229.1 uncharacterized protein F54H12.2-like [Corythoichthys intestinalis]XP_057686359.1 uncharacterized protein F54H12.2-like [Corythoichthys intestinalis]XP_057705630.1 un